METYSKFRPTTYDGHIEIDERENWLVVPVSQTRDSGSFDRTNFETALNLLGGEGETVEVHRFGHWGPGWFEIIIVDPNSPEAAIAEDIERSLENYPILDEEALSNAEYEDYIESWESGYCSDFVRGLVDSFDLTDDARDALEDLDDEVLREFYEELTDYPYESGSGGTYCDIAGAIRSCSEIDLMDGPLYDFVMDRLRALHSQSLSTGKPDLFGDEMRPFWTGEGFTLESIGAVYE